MTAQTVDNDKDKDTGAKTEIWETLSAASWLCLRHKALIFPCPEVKMRSVHCQIGINGRSEVFFGSACKSHVLGINNWY